MTDRIILAVTGSWIIATVIFFATPVTLVQYLSLSALLALGTGLYYISEREIVSDLAESAQANSGDKAIEALDLNRVEQTLDEYSERFYSEEDQIDVRWDLADHDMAELDSKGEEALLAVTGALGQNDRKIQVFIHLPSYKVPTHKRVRAGTHQEKYPFKYCDYYQENKSSQSDDLQQLTHQQNGYPGYYRPRMPPNSTVTKTSNTESEEGEE